MTFLTLNVGFVLFFNTNVQMAEPTSTHLRFSPELSCRRRGEGCKIPQSFILDLKFCLSGMNGENMTKLEFIIKFQRY